MPLEGADLAALADRFEKEEAVEGQATVTGTWQDGRVLVTSQGPPPAPVPRVEGEVPCPAPAGGWPQGPAMDNLSAELALVRERLPDLLDPVRHALLRPPDTQTLLGVAVADEAAREQAQRQLDELLPDRACVVVARHTDAEVDAAMAVDWFPFRGFRSSGTGMEALQTVVRVEVLVATDEITAEVARHPEGLVRLEPALRVVERSDRLVPPEPSAAPSAAPAALDGVLQPGDRATAVGTVRAADAKQPTSLCHPHQAYPAIGLPPGESLPCLGVELRGLRDLPAGSVRVTGTWDGEAVDVEQVHPQEPGPGHPGLPDGPCDVPEGGWPDGGAPYDDRSPDDAALSRYSEAHPELSASGRLMLLRPAPDRQVVTVVVSDQAERARVEAELAPDFPGRMCVVVQEADVDAASRWQRDPRLNEDRLMVSSTTSWGPGLRTRQAQVMVLRLAPAMLDVQREADGLVQLDPWLVRVD